MADVEPDEQESPPEPGPLGGHAARAAGERLRELAEAEHARVGAAEAEAAAAEAAAGENVEPETPHPLALLGAEPFTETILEGMGEPAAGYAPCPFCDGYGAVNPDELIAALPNVIERLAPYPASTVFVRCSECDGWGSVLTGGRTGENGIQPCPTCESHGYLDTRLRAGERVGPPLLVAGNGDTALDAGDDPFTVAPPEGVPPAAGMEWDAELGRWGYPLRAV